jgi:hypothetical protein
MGIQILNCASMSPWWPRWHVGGVCLLVDILLIILIISAFSLLRHPANSFVVPATLAVLKGFNLI